MSVIKPLIDLPVFKSCLRMYSLAMKDRDVRRYDIYIFQF